MNQLKEFYEAAEKNEELKKALLQANEEAKGLNEDQIKTKLIDTAAQFGYTLTQKDFEPQEGAIEGEELEKVSGGISSGCFLTNAGCTLIGEIGKDGGCLILGLY